MNSSPEVSENRLHRATLDEVWVAKRFCFGAAFANCPEVERSVTTTSEVLDGYVGLTAKLALAGATLKNLLDAAIPYAAVSERKPTTEEPPKAFAQIGLAVVA